MLPLEPQDGRLSGTSVWQRLIAGSGTDGLAVEVPCTMADPNELELIMQAWYRERSQAIESGMWLDRVETLLGRILKDETLSEASSIQVRTLLQGLSKLERPS